MDCILIRRKAPMLRQVIADTQFWIVYLKTKHYLQALPTRKEKRGFHCLVELKLSIDMEPIQLEGSLKLLP